MRIIYEHSEIVGMLESTYLKPDITPEILERMAEDAKKYRFAAVMVNPRHVARVAKLLKGTQVKVGTVIGFPLGEDLTEVKLLAMKKAIKQGADEIDVVAPISLVRQGKWDDVWAEINKLSKASKKKVLKVIFEVCYLTDEQIAELCKICVEAKVRYVKTSTGFGTGGATQEAVELMFKTVSEELKNYDREIYRTEVKASGGIRTYLDAKAMAESGATRIGTSCAREIADYVEPVSAVLDTAAVKAEVAEPAQEAKPAPKTEEEPNAVEPEPDCEENIETETENV